MMLTGREDVDTKLTALNAGFDDFVTKTSSEPEIVAKIVAARRLASRQRTMDTAIRDLYGLATRDDPTGLFNRRFFISETERMLAEGIPVNVVLLDQLMNAADRDMYKNKWVRRHPDERPDLYEYPDRERNVVARLSDAGKTAARN